MDKMLATLTLNLPPGELFIAQKALVAMWALKFEVCHRILLLDDTSLGCISRTCNHPKMTLGYPLWFARKLDMQPLWTDSSQFQLFAGLSSHPALPLCRDRNQNRFRKATYGCHL